MLNQIVLKTLPLVPKSIVRYFAKEYIAGEELREALNVGNMLKERGARVSIDVLGEYVTSKEQTLKDLEIRLEVIEKIKESNLDATESIKLTSLGLGLDDEFCYENTKRIVHHGKEHGVYIRIDMEDSPYHDRTLEIYKRLRDEGYDNVGLVFQACMKRTEEDIMSVIDYKPTIRLCKGIYIEPEDLAYHEFDEINYNYMKLLELLFDNDIFVGIATHDETLIQFAEMKIEEKNISKDRYEFQMLLGVRENKRYELIEKGHPLRVYVSFGEDWYGYTMRRFKENPEIAGHVFYAIFKKVFLRNP